MSSPSGSLDPEAVVNLVFPEHYPEEAEKYARYGWTGEPVRSPTGGEVPDLSVYDARMMGWA